MSAPRSVVVPVMFRMALLQRGAGVGRSTHVDLAILEALLQVVVDGLVGNLADQRQVRDAHFLLLGCLEDSLCCELGLLPWASSSAGGRRILLAPSALRYRTLHRSSVSVRHVVVWRAWADCTMAGARPQAPEYTLGWVCACLACRVHCWPRSAVVSARGMGSLGVAEGLQAQCVGEEEATFSESVVSEIGGLPSLRLGNPTNDVTAHVGRIGGGQWPVASGRWQRVECSSPHSHTLLRAGTRLTRKPCRRTTLLCTLWRPSTTWHLALLTTLH